MVKYNTKPLPEFKTAYEAGFDCGLHGASTFNSHYRWFLTKESMEEWQKGKRNAELKTQTKKIK